MTSFHILGGRTGISGVTMQPPGISSTRVSTAPLHNSPRYGMPVAPQNEQPRSSMSEAMAVLSANGNAVGPGKGEFILMHHFNEYIQSIQKSNTYLVWMPFFSVTHRLQ